MAFKEENMGSTVRNIRKLTGLSLSTISKYLNGGNVLPENKEAIEKAVDKLHYEINGLAGDLKTNKTKIVGVLIHDLSNIFAGTIISQIEDILRKHDYGMIICDSRGESGLEVEEVKFLLGKRVDGIITFPVSENADYLKPALERGIPVVLIDRIFAQNNFDSVIVDNEGAAKEATKKLIEYGHRKIGIICGDDSSFTAKGRLRGYCVALNINGIKPNENYILRGELSVSYGYKAMKELLTMEDRPTGVFLSNYEITLGAMIAINDSKLSFPEDISVIGFDNMMLAQVVKPSLWMVSQPLETIAQRAAEIMLEHLNENSTTDRKIEILKTKLIKGNSIAILNNGKNNMYKVLLVDDEILIRERIAKRIPWEELGFRLVTTCENGKEAIEILKKEEIDLVLTDICMPYIDGLELSKFIHEQKKNRKIIIISGYDEFEYAKKAVNYQVFSYILKPVTAAELIQTLKEVRQELDSERVNLQVQSIYQDSYPVLKNQFLNRLAQGKLPEEDIEEKLKEFHIHFSDEAYCAAIVYPEEKFEENDSENLIAALKAEVDTDVLPFDGPNGNIIIFVKEVNSTLVKKKMTKVCEILIEAAGHLLRKEVFCLIGTSVAKLSGLYFSCQKAMELYEYIYLEKESHIYEWDIYQKAKNDVDKMIYENNREQRILLAVQSNLMEDVIREIRDVKEESKDKWFTKNRIILLYQSLLLAVMNSFKQLDISEEELFEKNQEVVFSLYQCVNVSEMEEKMLDFFTLALKIMNRNRVNYGERQAAMALEYINRHYSDCDLTLQIMCEKMAISVSYFSSAFKDYTGMTFIEMLIKKRMEKAMKMLEKTSMKIYEIAEKCGYYDANYFSAIFKKTVGKTPREYLHSMKRQEEIHEKES